MRHAFVSWVLRIAVFGAIVAALAAGSYSRIFDSYELETLDYRFLLRPKIPTTDAVVLIEIGEDTIKKLGRFPFDRSYHALLVKALADFGARATVFDIFFSEPQEYDADFETAMRKAGNVYLPFVLDLDIAGQERLMRASGYAAKTLPLLAATARGEGHINIIPDIDGKFRRIPLYVRLANNLYPYISFKAACDYLGIPSDRISILPGKYLKAGADIRIPLDDRSNMIVNYSGAFHESYAHYSYVDVLQSYFATVSGQKPTIDPSAFKGKVCVVGLTAAGTVDLHPNPFETLSPGMGIHAEVFNAMVNRRFIERSSREENLAILAGIALLIALVTLLTRPWLGLAVLLAVVVIFIIGGMEAFNRYGTWIDLFYPVLVMGFTYLAVTIYKYIGEWKKRLGLEKELDIAKKIQESFLPKNLPALPGVDIAASMFTARQVGGDLYDFIDFGGKRLGVMVGDVSGKGVPASLFMAMVTGKFTHFAVSESRPADVVSRLNAQLVRESASNLFVTIFYAVFDLDRLTVTFSNGGHLPMARLSRGAAAAEFFDTEVGTPLGLMDGPYVEATIPVTSGDIFVFYTDGITEAMNRRRDMYGKERLAASIAAARSLSAKDIARRIERDVRRFEPRSRQHDDMTVIVIRITEEA